jgi:GT2 family glycosyltransferase
MIKLIHDDHKVIQVVGIKSDLEFSKLSISKAMIKIATDSPEELLIWSHYKAYKDLNLNEIPHIFHHKKIMASFAPSNYLGKEVGYLEDSPFIKINRKVNYPTWQMSSLVGGVNTSVINAIARQIKPNKDFDYFLNSFAKLAMPQGIFCYANPFLLKKKIETVIVPKAKVSKVFQFTAEHYKRRWTVLLLLNLFIFKKQIYGLSWLKSLFFKRILLNEGSFNHLKIESSIKVELKKRIDVIIPTIGRKKPLYDVLKDFSRQTILPKRIIVIEQNPNKDATSELDYIYQDKWPFEILHKFIHQTGACNARNIALDLVQNEWTFLADDDNRFDKYLIEKIFNKIQRYNLTCVTTAYVQNHEANQNPYVSQTTTFGAGNTFVKTNLLNINKEIRFGKGYEFGYGEDIDFGMQLRNKGCDIIFTPKPCILHLKAPVGGFRTTFKMAWENERIKPKPSPTIMLYKLNHVSKEQLASYKLNLFLKNINFRRPVSDFRKFQQQWDLSTKWAKKIQDAN